MKTLEEMAGQPPTGITVERWHRLVREVAIGGLRRIAADLSAEEVAHMRALFDMQWQRMREATDRWRAEDPEARALIMPDLGDLLQWLMAKLDSVTAQRNVPPAELVAAALHYAEGTIAPVAFAPESCGTCERAVSLTHLALRTYGNLAAAAGADV